MHISECSNAVSATIVVILVFLFKTSIENSFIKIHINFETTGKNRLKEV